MAKKKKEEQVTKWYTNKKNVLYLSNNYDYEMTVYELGYLRFTMVEEQTKSSKSFNFWTQNTIIEKGKKRYMQSIELVGAPEEFLKEQKFFEL